MDRKRARQRVLAIADPTFLSVLVACSLLPFGYKLVLVNKPVKRGLASVLVRCGLIAEVDLEALPHVVVMPDTYCEMSRHVLDYVSEASRSKHVVALAPRNLRSEFTQKVLQVSLQREMLVGHLDLWHALTYLRSQCPDSGVILACGGIRVRPLRHAFDPFHVVWLPDVGRIVSFLRTGLFAVRSRFAGRTVESSTVTQVALCGDTQGEDVASIVLLNRGWAYGSLYRYDYVLSDDPDSLLHPSRVRAMSIIGDGDITRLPLKPIGIRVFIRLLYSSLAVGASKRKCLPVRERLFLSQVLARSLRLASELAFEFPRLQVMYLAYEIQTPPEVVIACEQLGCETVAAHERPSTALDGSLPFAVSSLLTLNPQLSELVALSRSVAVRRTIPVGSWRLDLAKRNPQVQHARRVEGRSSKIRVLVLPYHLDEKSPIPFVTSERSVVGFITDVLLLAKTFLQAEFFIRYKDCSWDSIPDKGGLRREIEKAPNVYIDCNPKPGAAYELLAQSHLVLAKPTSMVDEALAMGIPVILHDFSGPMSYYSRYIWRHLPSSVWVHSQLELVAAMSVEFNRMKGSGSQPFIAPGGITEGSGHGRRGHGVSSEIRRQVSILAGWRDVDANGSSGR